MGETNDRKKGVELDAIDLSSFLKKQPVEKEEEEKKDPEPVQEADATEMPEDKIGDKIEDEPENKIGDKIEIPDAEEIEFTREDTRQKSKFYVLLWCLPVVIGLSVLIFYLTGSLSTHKSFSKDVPEPLNNFIIEANKTTDLLNKSINHLNTISNRINSQAKIAQILDAIKIAGDILPKYEMLIKRLTRSIQNNKKDLQENGLGVLVETGDYYGGKINTHYLEVLKKCIALQKRYLIYYNDKYDLIVKRQQPQIQSYEVIYLQYKRALEEYEMANTKKTNFIKPFLKKYPFMTDFFLYDNKKSIFSTTK